jgi:Cof subfamily protein (haloacid dehalogenase superfamily)
MAGIGLVAFDLDGTVLNGLGGASERSVATILRMLDAGITVASISGRNVQKSQAPFEVEIGSRLFVGSYNGALVLSAAAEGSRKLLLEQRLPKSEFDDLVQYIADLQMNFVYCGCEVDGADVDEAYVTDRDSASIRNLHALTGIEFRFDEALCDRIQGGELGPSPKLILMPGDEHRDQTLAEVTGIFGDRLYIARTGDDRIEVMHPKVNKAVALQAICTECGVEMDNTLALGDGDNDLPMLKEAGLGVLMGNADVETRQVAMGEGVVLCPSLEEEGFSAAVEQYVFG